MKLFLSLFTVLFTITFIVAMPVSAEFSIGNSPNISAYTHGNTDYQTWTLSGTYPLGLINGYVGAEWIRFQSEENKSHFIRARIDGGYNFGFLGVRAYGRYGKKSIAQQDSLFHSGVYLHADLINNNNLKFSVGAGTWQSKEELNNDYHVDTSLEFGPQFHTELKLFSISLLAEYLPDTTFDKYKIRVVPIWTIPIAQFLFIEQLDFEISGEIEYNSSTYHVDIEQLHWHWRHGLKFSF